MSADNDSPAAHDWFVKTYRASAAERIDIGFAINASPDAVVKWLQDTFVVPDTGIYGEPWRKPDRRDLLEYVLLKRNHPLIDYGLARYGRSPRAVQRVYNRGNTSVRLAALANPQGSMSLKQAEEILLQGKWSELEAFFSNPTLRGGLFTNLFEKKAIFQQIDGHRFEVLIGIVAGHPRLSREYKATYMDGWDDYTYHETFSAAWELARTVPTTEKWAWLLTTLLDHCVKPRGFKDPEEILQRWRLDVPTGEGVEWFERGGAFALRALIASLISDDKTLLESDDAALRMAFYRRFDPRKYPSWSDYLENDGAEFVHYAMENELLWCDKKHRDALQALCWRCPDPQSRMDVPNEFLGRKRQMEELHPEWFKDVDNVGAENGESIPSSTETMLSEVRASTKEVAQRIESLASSRNTYLGWWVAGALLLYILFR